MRKVLGWGSVALLIWFVVTQPANAAKVVRGIGSGLAYIATQFGSFITNLV